MAEKKRITEKMIKPEKSNVYTIYEDQTVGKVQIQDNVIATIAALAATETDGVASLGGGITHDKAARISAKNLAKGVKIEVTGNEVTVRTILNMNYGCNIPDVTLKVQEKVKDTIETMTGLVVSKVDVSVADVQID
ncbi:MAG: Asp23/Gls24 family envelope stress response protein [Eubacterium sp.]|nr:Asp23/Gls24 family envelope stress response protein [Eubacterium sp.]